MNRYVLRAVLLLSVVAFHGTGCGGGSETGALTPGEAPERFTLSVEKFGLGTITADSGNLDCVAVDCPAAYVEGDVVTLDAHPFDGWRLHHWTGADAVDGGRCTVTMDRAEDECLSRSSVRNPSNCRMASGR